eukprot:CAMPEP_0113591636 /NCGR_PEP_ID=MMETSP0015_2-20120614/37379_1 /TAXON_ID=2838 /ORGANISM="Odontella" /LENGTH=510 /DNA_ID=CAMNT_0000498039 /DNA_START=111 /DNA_END=1644 /DNA_ORIENTATION=+ /assembly_acc=CAM_ASM_000160
MKCSTLWVSALTLISSAVNAQYDASLFPLQPNTAVVTCGSTQGGGYVLGIIDTRDPACDAPTPRVGGPDNWLANMYHGEDHYPWTKANLRSEIFGLALDDQNPVNIFVLPTTVYGPRGDAPQEVWKINGSNGTKTVLATLPTGNDPANPFADKNFGLGQVAYHRTYKQLYVTSFSDGWIYRLDADTGNVLSTFDPLLGGTGSLYDPATDTGKVIDVSDRIWAVQVRYEYLNEEWELNPVQYEVGIIANGKNSAGGVDFSDCVEGNECHPTNYTYVTTDAIQCCSPPNNIYGLSIIPAMGGDQSVSYGIDFDGDTITQDKTQNGDVEVVRTCSDDLVNNDPEDPNDIETTRTPTRTPDCIFGVWDADAQECACFGGGVCMDGFCPGEVIVDEDLGIAYHPCDIPKAYPDGGMVFVEDEVYPVPGGNIHVGACCMCSGQKIETCGTDDAVCREICTSFDEDLCAAYVNSNCMCDYGAGPCMYDYGTYTQCYSANNGECTGGTYARPDDCLPE